MIRGDSVPPSVWQTGQPFRGAYLLKPGSLDEVSAVLATCNAEKQPVVPIGGVTNLVQACATTPGDLGLSLDRLSAVEECDPVAQTMTVQAGITLAAAQQAADAAGLYFPVDIGSRDNCTLGGNVATNAGGTKVIRYGMIRDSILGLEAVLADGTAISSLNRYIKNNSGYDLKQLFIGTEGTLGVITRMVVRLRVAPSSHNVALLGARSYADILAMLDLARRQLGADLCGFEVMWRDFYAKATQPLGPHESPVDSGLPFYAIVETMGDNAASDELRFAEVLEDMFSSACVADGVIAKSGREREAIWAIRHEVEWLVRDAHNFDVSLRISDAEAFVEDIRRAIVARLPGAYVAAFGHLGDNNLHVSVLADGDDSAEIIEREIYTALQRYAGAVSAEHGIGLEKRPHLAVSRSSQEIDLMHYLKKQLDPNNILNPGKVVDLATEIG